MSWAPDFYTPRGTYLAGIARLAGQVNTAGKAYGWYLTDERGNAISKKSWVCRGNLIKASGTVFNAELDTRRLGRGHLYYWIVESKLGRTSHRYAHPFRMPTKPISAYADRYFVSRMRTRELPFRQPVKDALAGKPWTGGAGESGAAPKPKPPPGGSLAPPSDFKASYDPSGDGTPLLVTFRNTTSSVLRSVRVYWNLGRCPKITEASDLGGFRVIERATPGQRVHIDDELPSVVPGGSRRVCVAAWSLAKDNSVSAAVTSTFELPA
jgi:hypothetical protein